MGIKIMTTDRQLLVIEGGDWNDVKEFVKGISERGAFDADTKTWAIKHDAQQLREKLKIVDYYIEGEESGETGGNAAKSKATTSKNTSPPVAIPDTLLIVNREEPDSFWSDDELKIVLDGPAPIEQVDKHQIVRAMNRLRVIIPDGKNMNEAQLETVATHCLLYRVMPKIDVHFWLFNGKLIQSWHYAYLKRFCDFMAKNNGERISIKIHKIENNTDHWSCTVRITSDKAMREYTSLVKEWKGILGDPTEAIKYVNEMMLPYVEATCILNKNYPNGKKYSPPETWTPEEVVEKRATKLAITKYFGLPSPEVSQQMAQSLGHRQYWKGLTNDNFDPSLSPGAAEELAKLESWNDERVSKYDNATDEEKAKYRADIEGATNTMRGKEDDGID